MADNYIPWVSKRISKDQIQKLSEAERESGARALLEALPKSGADVSTQFMLKNNLRDLGWKETQKGWSHPKYGSSKDFLSTTPAEEDTGITSGKMGAEGMKALKGTYDLPDLPNQPMVFDEGLDVYGMSPAVKQRKKDEASAADAFKNFVLSRAPFFGGKEETETVPPSEGFGWKKLPELKEAKSDAAPDIATDVEVQEPTVIDTTEVEHPEQEVSVPAAQAQLPVEPETPDVQTEEQPEELSQSPADFKSWILRGGFSSPGTLPAAEASVGPEEKFRKVIKRKPQVQSDEEIQVSGPSERTILANPVDLSPEEEDARAQGAELLRQDMESGKYPVQPLYVPPPEEIAQEEKDSEDSEDPFVKWVKGLKKAGEIKKSGGLIPKGDEEGLDVLSDFELAPYTARTRDFANNITALNMAAAGIPFKPSSDEFKNYLLGRGRMGVKGALTPGQLLTQKRWEADKAAEKENRAYNRAAAEAREANRNAHQDKIIELRKDAAKAKDADDMRKWVSSTREEFQRDPVVKDAINVDRAYDRISKLADNVDPQGASDYYLVKEIVKLQDSSAVLQGEFDAAAAVGNIIQRMLAKVGEVTEGTKLTPEQRTAFKEKAAILRDLAKDAYNQRRSDYRSIARAAGLSDKASEEMPWTTEHIIGTDVFGRTPEIGPSPTTGVLTPPSQKAPAAQPKAVPTKAPNKTPKNGMVKVRSKMNPNFVQPVPADAAAKMVATGNYEYVR